MKILIPNMINKLTQKENIYKIKNKIKMAINKWVEFKCKHCAL